MLNKIIHFRIKNKLIVAVFTIALLVWGLWSATKLPVDALPDRLKAMKVTISEIFMGLEKNNKILAALILTESPMLI